MSGAVTTHALDLSKGEPAAGMKVELWLLHKPEDSAAGGTDRLLAEVRLNEDGRSDEPLAVGLRASGIYELRFYAGSYFGPESPVFLDVVPIRFTVQDPGAHYHVPLLVSPGGYSTYRGS